MNAKNHIMSKMKYHYMRVSTDNQKTSSQELKELGKDYTRMKEDKGVSGKTQFRTRPKGRMIMDEVYKGNVSELWVYSISRLGRNAIDVLQTIKELTGFGVNVISYKEGLRTLNDDGTENKTAKLMIGMLATFAEFEREMINERVRDGIAKAKEQGTYNNRPNHRPKESDAQFMAKKDVKKIIKYYKQDTFSRRQIAALSGCSVGKVQKAIKKYEALQVIEGTIDTAKKMGAK